MQQNNNQKAQDQTDLNEELAKLEAAMNWMTISASHDWSSPQHVCDKCSSWFAVCQDLFDYVSVPTLPWCDFCGNHMFKAYPKANVQMQQSHGAGA